MNKYVTAIALAIALPAVAHAQSAAAPAAKMDCCAKMKAEGKECCCKDMARMDHGKKAAADAHAGHDMSQAPQPAGHPNHQ